MKADGSVGAASTPAWRSWPIPNPPPTLSLDSRPGDQRARHALEAFQIGRCAVCGDQVGDHSLRTDHDHETGAVRGLLCPGCNIREGNGNPDPRLVAYRTDPPAKLLKVAADYTEFPASILAAGIGPPIGTWLDDDDMWWRNHSEAGDPHRIANRQTWTHPAHHEQAVIALRYLRSKGHTTRARDAIAVLTFMVERPGQVVGWGRLHELSSGPLSAVWSVCAMAVDTRGGAPPLHRRWIVRGGESRAALRSSTCLLLTEAGINTSGGESYLG